MMARQPKVNPEKYGLHDAESLSRSKGALIKARDDAVKVIEESQEYAPPSDLNLSYQKAIAYNKIALDALSGKGRHLSVTSSLIDNEGNPFGKEQAETIDAILGAAAILKELGFHKLSDVLQKDKVHFVHQVFVSDLERTVNKSVAAKRESSISSKDKCEVIRARAKALWLNDPNLPMTGEKGVAKILAEEFCRSPDRMVEVIQDLNPRKGKRGRVPKRK
ncbi:hypothetical protein [Zobellella denitrificans]